MFQLAVTKPADEFIAFPGLCGAADLLVYNMKSSCFINNANMSTRRYMSAVRIASTTTHTLFPTALVPLRYPSHSPLVRPCEDHHTFPSSDVMKPRDDDMGCSSGCRRECMCSPCQPRGMCARVDDVWRRRRELRRGDTADNLKTQQMGKVPPPAARPSSKHARPSSVLRSFRSNDISRELMT
jgi:hypothetical protein